MNANKILSDVALRIPRVTLQIHLKFVQRLEMGKFQFHETCMSLEIFYTSVLSNSKIRLDLTRYLLLHRRHGNSPRDLHNICG